MKQNKFHTNNQWSVRGMTVAERFWSKVEKLDACWFWLAGLNPSGYGMFWLDGRDRPAHRVAWELERGFIPEELEVDHLCRNPSCVNPDHLEPVTPQENQRRGFGVAGINARKTHCKRGHPFDEENTYRFMTSRGHEGRMCRTCQLERQRLRRAS